MVWIKEGVRYTWEQNTKWFDELVSTSNSQSERYPIRSGALASGLGRPTMSLPKDVKNKPIEELAQDFLSSCARSSRMRSAVVPSSHKNYFGNEKG